MAAVELRSAKIVAALLGTAALSACAPHAQPKTLPSQTVTQTKPDPPPPSEQPVPAPPKNETIVIESGTDSGGETTSVVAAAKAERERRRTAPPPTIVLDNKSLPQYATGQLTVVSHQPTDTTAAGELDAQAKREKYWRDRALAARQAWHDAAEAIATNEKAAAELRTRFYSEDDPFVRDGQIKPAWDRALDLLSQAKRDAATAETAVADMMEEGRREGAWPGWLREGLELEPQTDGAPAASGAEPGEPTVVQEPPGEPTPP